MIKISLFSMYSNDDNILVPLLDTFLENYEEENDRAPDVISPSLCGECARKLVFGRVIKGGRNISARTQRIFDNGTYTHNRLQFYFRKQGILLMDEVPLRNDQYNVQGHTDGLLDIYGSIYSNPELSLCRPEHFSPYITKYAKIPPDAWKIKELNVLEIKSIKQENYDLLTKPEDKHVCQASIYMFCLEERRKHLFDTYPTWKDFISSESDRVEYFKGVYSFFKDGEKYTKEEKIERKVKECLISDILLYLTAMPINKSIFIYENKNTQEIKEFTIDFSSEIMNDLKKQFVQAEESIKFIRWFSGGKKHINSYNKIVKRLLPDRGGKSKSCKVCRYCDYNELCWL